MNRRMSLLFIFIILLLIGCAHPGEMVEIGFKLQRGDIFEGEIEIDQTIIQDVSNQKFETNQSSIATIRFTVKDNRNKSIKIDTTYETILLHIKNPLINIKYDSQSKNNADELEIIKNIINKKITVLINERGAIQSIEGINPIINSIIRNNALNPIATATVIAFFNEKQLRNTFAYLFNYLSRKRVRAGDTWSNSQAIVLDNSTLKTNNKWKLVKINDDTISLNLKARIAGNKVSGEQEGDLEIDKQTGWVSSGNIIQSIPVSSEPGSIGLKSTIALKFEKIK